MGLILGLLSSAKGSQSFLYLRRQQEGTCFWKYFLAPRISCMSVDVSNILRHGFCHGVMPLPNHHPASEVWGSFHPAVAET